MVHYYYTYENINQFSIGYMINLSLKFNNAFRTQVEKCLGCSFSIRKMKAIKSCQMNNNKYVMVLIIIYKNDGDIPKNCIEC